MKKTFREIVCRYYEICVERSYRGGILNEFWFGKANAINQIIGALNNSRVKELADIILAVENFNICQSCEDLKTCDPHNTSHYDKCELAIYSVAIKDKIKTIISILGGGE